MINPAQLSQASPAKSASLSSWDALAVSGQLSARSTTPSLSVSAPAEPQAIPAGRSTPSQSVPRSLSPQLFSAEIR